MKKGFIICLFALFTLTASIYANISWKGRWDLAKLKFTNFSTYVLNYSPPNTTRTVDIMIDYYEGPLPGARILEFSDGQNTYSLIMSNGNVASGSIPLSLNLSGGTYTWTITSYSYLEGLQTYETSASVTFTVQPALIVNNSYGAGNVIINQISQSSGYTFNPVPASTTSLTAIDNQTNGAYVMSFQNWSLSDETSPSSLSTSVSAPSNNHGTCTANFLKICDISLATSYGSGTLSYEGGYVSTPYNTTKTEDNTVSLSASSTAVSGSMAYSFTTWSDGNTNASRTKYISEHTSLTANYTVVKPTNDYRYLTYTYNVGNYITLNWNEHPNTGVDYYDVYRSVKFGAQNVFLARVYRGTTTYTDTEYKLTDGYTDDLLYYDVRAHYSPNDSYTDNGYLAIFGESTGGDPNIVSSKPKDISGKIIPVEYKLTAYPNPFNPSTVIRYSMPETGEVSLKVYNLLSQEVANLAEGIKSAGVHTANFNAGNLPSGIYIVRLQAGSKIMSQKIQLLK